MKCFFHSADLDGKCAGAIVKREFADCEMYGINYGDQFPWAIIKPNETVFMVDFSLSIPEMKRLNELADLVWIDHHKSAIEEAARCAFAAGKQRLRIGKAACELTWEYLYTTPAPGAVVLLGRYDVWRHHETPGALEFQYGMRMYDCYPENRTVWGPLLAPDYDPMIVEMIIDTGRTLMEYERRQNELYVKALGFDVEMDGYRFIAVNKGLTSSLLFAAVWDPGKYDGMLAFCRARNGQWKISIYTDKPGVDASAICKARGGGGHVGAAGFQCEVLPFLPGPGDKVSRV